MNRQLNHGLDIPSLISNASKTGCYSADYQREHEEQDSPLHQQHQPQQDQQQQQRGRRERLSSLNTPVSSLRNPTSVLAGSHVVVESERTENNYLNNSPAEIIVTSTSTKDACNTTIPAGTSNLNTNDCQQRSMKPSIITKQEQQQLRHQQEQQQFQQQPTEQQQQQAEQRKYNHSREIGDDATTTTTSPLRTTTTAEAPRSSLPMTSGGDSLVLLSSKSDRRSGKISLMASSDTANKGSDDRRLYSLLMSSGLHNRCNDSVSTSSSSSSSNCAPKNSPLSLYGSKKRSSEIDGVVGNSHEEEEICEEAEFNRRSSSFSPLSSSSVLSSPQQQQQPEMKEVQQNSRYWKYRLSSNKSNSITKANSSNSHDNRTSSISTPPPPVPAPSPFSGILAATTATTRATTTSTTSMSSKIRNANNMLMLLPEDEPMMITGDNSYNKNMNDSNFGRSFAYDPKDENQKFMFESTILVAATDDVNFGRYDYDKDENDSDPDDDNNDVGIRHSENNSNNFDDSCSSFQSLILQPRTYPHSRYWNNSHLNNINNNMNNNAIPSPIRQFQLSIPRAAVPSSSETQQSAKTSPAGGSSIFSAIKSLKNNTKTNVETTSLSLSKQNDGSSPEKDNDNFNDNMEFATFNFASSSAISIDGGSVDNNNDEKDDDEHEKADALNNNNVRSSRTESLSSEDVGYSVSSPTSADTGVVQSNPEDFLNMKQRIMKKSNQHQQLHSMISGTDDPRAEFLKSNTANPQAQTSTCFIQDDEQRQSLEGNTPQSFMYRASAAILFDENERNSCNSSSNSSSGRSKDGGSSCSSSNSNKSRSNTSQCCNENDFHEEHPIQNHLYSPATTATATTAGTDTDSSAIKRRPDHTNDDNETDYSLQHPLSDGFVDLLKLSKPEQQIEANRGTVVGEDNARQSRNEADTEQINDCTDKQDLQYLSDDGFVDLLKPEESAQRISPYLGSSLGGNDVSQAQHNEVYSEQGIAYTEKQDSNEDQQADTLPSNILNTICADTIHNERAKRQGNLLSSLPLHESNIANEDTNQIIWEDQSYSESTKSPAAAPMFSHADDLPSFMLHSIRAIDYHDSYFDASARLNASQQYSQRRLNGIASSEPVESSNNTEPSLLGYRSTFTDSRTVCSNDQRVGNMGVAMLPRGNKKDRLIPLPEEPPLTDSPITDDSGETEEARVSMYDSSVFMEPEGSSLHDTSGHSLQLTPRSYPFSRYWNATPDSASSKVLTSEGDIYQIDDDKQTDECELEMPLKYMSNISNELLSKLPEEPPNTNDPKDRAIFMFESTILEFVDDESSNGSGSTQSFKFVPRTYPFSRYWNATESTRPSPEAITEEELSIEQACESSLIRSSPEVITEEELSTEQACDSSVILEPPPTSMRYRMNFNDILGPLPEEKPPTESQAGDDAVQKSSFMFDSTILVEADDDDTSRRSERSQQFVPRTYPFSRYLNPPAINNSTSLAHLSNGIKLENEVVGCNDTRHEEVSNAILPDEDLPNDGNLGNSAGADEDPTVMLQSTMCIEGDSDSCSVCSRSSRGSTVERCWDNNGGETETRGSRDEANEGLKDAELNSFSDPVNPQAPTCQLKVTDRIIPENVPDNRSSSLYSRELRSSSHAVGDNTSPHQRKKNSLDSSAGTGTILSRALGAWGIVFNSPTSNAASIDERLSSHSNAVSEPGIRSWSKYVADSNKTVRSDGNALQSRKLRTRRRLFRIRSFNPNPRKMGYQSLNDEFSMNSLSSTSEPTSSHNSFSNKGFYLNVSLREAKRSAEGRRTKPDDAYSIDARRGNSKQDNIPIGHRHATPYVPPRPLHDNGDNKAPRRRSLHDSSHSDDSLMAIYRPYRSADSGLLSKDDSGAKKMFSSPTSVLPV